MMPDSGRRSIIWPTSSNTNIDWSRPEPASSHRSSAAGLCKKKSRLSIGNFHSRRRVASCPPAGEARYVGPTERIEPYMLVFVMTWLAWLGLAVLITAVAAITGIKPKGTRHVSHTRLMGVARLALLAGVIIFAYLAFRARSGG
jgi:hypothetical protein